MSALSPRVEAVARPRRAPRGERIALCLLAAGSALLIAVALTLKPDPRGFGTHEGLGLPPCGLMRLTGVPCPSCGMTTAFAHTVRFHFVEGARAQPMGFLIALSAMLFAAAGPFVAALGVPTAVRVRQPLPRRLALGFIALTLLAWVYKIVVTRMGMP